MQNPTTDGGRNDQETTDAPERLALVLDLTHQTGREWLRYYGEMREGHDFSEPIVRESLEGVVKCEQCRERRVTYTLDQGRAGVPVCRECIDTYEWVTEVRED